jgi:hypothetical protein
MNCPYPECNGSLVEDILICGKCSRAAVVCENPDCGRAMSTAARICPKCGKKQEGVSSWTMAGGSSGKTGVYRDWKIKHNANRLQVGREWEYATESKIVRGLLEVGGFLVIPQVGGRISIIRSLDRVCVKNIDLGHQNEIKALPAISNMKLYVVTGTQIVAIPIHDLFGSTKTLNRALDLSETYEIGLESDWESTEVVAGDSSPGKNSVAFVAMAEHESTVCTLSPEGKLFKRSFAGRVATPIFDERGDLYIGTSGGVVYKYDPDLGQCHLSNESMPLSGVGLRQGLTRYKDKILLCDRENNIRYSVISGDMLKFPKIKLKDCKARVFAISDAHAQSPGDLVVSGMRGCYLFRELFTGNYEYKNGIKRTSFTYPLILDSLVVFALDNGRCHFISRAKPSIQGECPISYGVEITLPMAASPDGGVFAAYEDQVVKVKAYLT